jgi:hypothetical protein
MTKHVDSICPSKFSLKDPCEHMEGTSHLNTYKHITPNLNSHQDMMDREKLNGTRKVNHSHFQHITSIMVSYYHLWTSMLYRMTRKGGGYIHVSLMVWQPILASWRRRLDSNSMLSSPGVDFFSMFAMSRVWERGCSYRTRGSHKWISMHH